jgi:outer membrane protein assembly factor BamD (BamD/ComL family)
MSVAAIAAAANWFNAITQNPQSSRQQLQQEFQQLGTDLSSGNLSAAQSLFSTMQQGFSSNSTSTQSSNPIAQAFQQLSQDLKSGNLSAAQKDYSTIQQDQQSQSAQSQVARAGHHHHHISADTTSTDSTNNSAITQLMNELGSALQSGNLPNAQQAYSSLQQDLLQFTQSGLTTAAPVSLTA